MPPAKPFEFLEVGLPADGDLRQRSRRTLERLGAPFCCGPPAYPPDAGAERRKMCFRVALT